ncbi:hypothetical protein HIM_06579 [Hirsutella minnesotensis 3608]|uniref:Uncharacterized protein n=1 Tax=Hirsutella minnesotensis 3608 TaxID=1043627 RepID=A0A0F7ZNP9_9HYPO|nr:hypothetical protein HIM_06579 [Hirsutella minnesotensis 3608]
MQYSLVFLACLTGVALAQPIFQENDVASLSLAKRSFSEGDGQEHNRKPVHQDGPTSVQSFGPNGIGGSDDALVFLACLTGVALAQPIFQENNVASLSLNKRSFSEGDGQEHNRKKVHQNGPTSVQSFGPNGIGGSDDAARAQDDLRSGKKTNVVPNKRSFSEGDGQEHNRKQVHQDGPTSVQSFGPNGIGGSDDAARAQDDLRSGKKTNVVPNKRSFSEGDGQEHNRKQVHQDGPTSVQSFGPNGIGGSDDAARAQDDLRSGKKTNVVPN